MLSIISLLAAQRDHHLGERQEQTDYSQCHHRKPPGRKRIARLIHTTDGLANGKPEVVELVAHRIFYAHHLFMQILDVKNHAGGRYERFIRDLILDLLNGDETRWGMLNWPPIPNLNLPSTSQCEAANFAFIVRLRAFVDGFIQTGIDNSGVETPSSRRVRASVDESPIMTVSPDETTVVIFDEIYESWRRNLPQPLLNGDGTMAVGVNQPRWENQAPELYARDMATYYFQDFSHRHIGPASASARIPSANDTSFVNGTGRRQSNVAVIAAVANL